MDYTINEIVENIEKEIEKKRNIFDVREYLLSIYKENGIMVEAFHDSNREKLRDSIGNLFLTIILITKQYNIDYKNLEWDDEGVDISTDYMNFYKETILLNSVIGNLSSEVFAEQYANINSDISNEIEGMLEKISNVACASSILLEEAVYYAYENWKS